MTPPETATKARTPGVHREAARVRWLSVGVVVRDVMHEVPGELIRLLDQRPHVVAAEAIDHPAPIAAGLHQAHQTQPAQVLRHRGARGADLGTEGIYVLLAVAQQTQQVQTCRVGEVAQHVRGQDELVARVGLSHLVRICQVVVRAHGCIMARGPASWQP